MARVIAIANQKGGVGKTTTAINLGACIAARGRRVLLIDIDPQGNATSGLGIEKRDDRKSVYDVIIEGMSITEALISIENSRLHLCPSDMRLAGAEIELVSMMSRENRLKSSLEKIADDYDYIMIDCPPSLGLLTLNSLTAADTVLVPIQCEYYALEGLSQLMNTIKLVKKHLNRELEIEGVVLTMFDGRTNLSVQVVDEVRKHFSSKVFKTVIPRNVKLSEAPSHGLPIIDYAGSSKGAEAYIELAEELIRYSEKKRLRRR